MKWLHKTKEFLSSEFSTPNWADNLNIDSTEDQFTKRLIEKEQHILIIVFEYLNFSVIEGEYISNRKHFNEVIKEIYSLVKNLQSVFITNDDDFKLSAAFDRQQFLYAFKKALEFYIRIANNINNQIENPHKTIVIDISDTLDGTNKYFFSKDDILEESLFDLFNQNLILSRTGFFLENHNGEFRYLLEAQDSLKKLKSKINYPSTNYSHIIDILTEICTFYQRKIITRIGQNESRYNDGYIFNSEEYNFTLNEHPFNKDYFKKWDEYSQNHFFSETSKEREILLKRYAENLIKTKNISDFSFFDAHSLIKFYKDIIEELVNLEALMDVFEKFEAKSSYDKFALNVSKNYLKNNILSLKMKEICLADIDNLISEYKKLQQASSINNFFPFYKICIYLKKYIETHISIDKLEKENLNNVELALKKLKTSFKLYKENFQWSESHLYYAYQLPFEESNIKVDLDNELTINIFIPSSFSLTIDYSKYDTFLKEIESFILNFDNQIKSLKNIYFSNIKLIEKQEKIQIQLKDQEKKNLEILGIFSAIIALLFQGVNTAQSSEKIQYKLITFLSMFLVLFSFLFMIKIFFNKDKKTKKMSVWFQMSVFGLMFIVLILIYSLK